MITPTVRRIIFENPPDEDAKKMERGIRAGMREATKHWQREFAPRHFEWGASGKYGYKPRSPKYYKRKQRVMGHRRPLVYTGETLKWVTTRFAQPTARRTGVGFVTSLPVVVPPYFFKYRGIGSDKYDELTRTLPQEYEALFQIVDKHIDEALARRSRRRAE